MNVRYNCLIRLLNAPSPATCLFNPRLFSTTALLGSAETLAIKNDICKEEKNQIEIAANNHSAKDCREVFMNWGCTQNDISLIFTRRPSIRRSNPIALNSKLKILSKLGLDSSDLVKIVNRRPRFFSSCIHQLFKDRLDFLLELFVTREILRKAIVRNPSLLTYDLHRKMKPAIDLYEKMGVGKKELVPMLISYPALIPRTVFNEEKVSYIRKTGVIKGSKLYKYVVCIIGISRVETIREKISNFEKFGFSDDEVLQLIGRQPVLLTFSVEKIQRNMTYILGTLKLSASVALDYPFLLYYNLETLLKPRFLLAGKIKDMGLQPQIQGPALLRALRMKEDRFTKVFILCHPEDVAKELMDYYTNAKRVKRLAESSKKSRFRVFHL